MIFRLTQKLTKKIGITTSAAIPLDQNPYTDWCANLFIVERIQYIILTNTASLYSMIMRGRGVSNDKKFIQESLTCMKELMTTDGNASIFEHFIEPSTDDASFCKMTDRRVIGSINDLVFLTKFHLTHSNKLLNDVSHVINYSPMSFLKYGCPKDVFKTMGNLSGEGLNVTYRLS
jgi:hypothetical protein